MRIQGVVNSISFNKTMQAIASRIVNRRPALKKIGIYAAASVALNFYSGGRPIRWAPLSDRTLKERGKNAKALLRTGRGVHSIQAADKSVPSLEATNNAVEFGTNVDYLLIHNEGGKTLERRIPGVKVKAHKRVTNTGKIVRVKEFVRTQFEASHIIPQREFMIIQAQDWQVFTSILLNEFHL